MSARLWLCAVAALLVGTQAFAADRTVAGQIACEKPIIEIRQKIPERLEPGAAAPIEIHIANVGSMAVLDLVVTDRLPAGYDLLDASPVPERRNGRLHWMLGRLAPREAKVIRISLAPKPGARTVMPRNTVLANYHVESCNTAIAEVLRPDLGIQVSGPKSGFAGKPIQLVLTTANLGSGIARKVILHSQLQDGLDHPGGHDLEKEIGDLAPGDSRSVPLFVTPRRAGEFHATVSVEGHRLEPVPCDVSLFVQDDSLEMTAKGPKQCFRDWPCSYSFTVQNRGLADLSHASLVVQLPPGIAFIKGEYDAAYDSQAHTIRWNITKLGAGKSCTATWTGVAQVDGPQQGRVTLSVGKTGFRQMIWATKVIPMTASASAN